jgi:hypothetical protein
MSNNLSDQSDSLLSNNLSDQRDRPRRPPRDPTWAIRDMAPAEREAALAAAARMDMSIGAWLAEAIRLKLAADRGEGQSNNLSDPLREAAAIAWATAEASQKPLPRSLSRLIYKQVAARIVGGSNGWVDIASAEGEGVPSLLTSPSAASHAAENSD